MKIWNLMYDSHDDGPYNYSLGHFKSKADAQKLYAEIVRVLKLVKLNDKGKLTIEEINVK